MTKPPQSRKPSNFVVAVVMVSFTLLAASWMVQYWSYRRDAAARDLLRQSYETLARHRELRARLSEAGMAMRGFLLTGEDHSLQSLAGATNGFQELLASTHVLAQGDPVEQEKLLRLEPKVRVYFRLIGESVELRRKGQSVSAERQFQISSLRDSVRDLCSEITRAEEDSLKAVEIKAHQRGRMAQWTAFGGGAVALGLIAVSSMILVRENKARQRAEARLQEANVELEHRVEERTLSLREQEQRLAAIVETAAEGVITFEPSGIVESINIAAEQMFGCRTEEVIGKNINRLIPVRDDENDFVTQWLAGDESKSINSGREMTGQRQDGTTFPIEISISEVKLPRGRLFTGLVRDITQRKRLEAEVTSAAEQERGRIARDLHDGLGQQLGGALFLGDLLRRDLKERGIPEGERADQIHSIVTEALGQVREVARGLYPVPPEPDGLMTALQNLADRVTRDRPIDCTFDTDSAVLLSDQTTATHLYRIAQEAVNNALKHSGASKIAIRLASTAQKLELSVRDNGKGVPDSPAQGLGLQTMTHRAHAIGGRVLVRNVSTGGTEMVCSMPRPLSFSSPLAATSQKQHTSGNER